MLFSKPKKLEILVYMVKPFENVFLYGFQEIVSKTFSLCFLTPKFEIRMFPFIFFVYHFFKKFYF